MAGDKYLIEIHRMMVSDEADVVPTFGFVADYDALKALDVTGAIDAMNKAVRLQDGPFTNLRTMTGQEIQEWREAREEILNGADETWIEEIGPKVN